MDKVWVPLVAAVIGGLIATVGSAITMLIQNRRESRRHRREIATSLAIEDRGRHIEFAQSQPTPSTIPPLEIYVAYHVALLDLLEDGPLTADGLAEMNRKQKRLKADYDVVRNVMSDKNEVGDPGS